MSQVNINRVNLTGNLTRDPDLRYTANQTAVANMRLAVNERYKDKDSGEWQDKANFFDVVVFKAQAETCAKHLAKGSPVAVEGRLASHDWEDKDGNKRQSVNVVANKVQFLGNSGERDRDRGAEVAVGVGAGPVQDAAPSGVDDDIPF